MSERPRIPSGEAAAAPVDRLLQIVEFFASATTGAPGWVWPNAARMLLDLGEPVSTSIDQGPFLPGEARDCYATAAAAALVQPSTGRHWLYAEGYALVERFDMTFEHAWLVEVDAEDGTPVATGRIADPTWGPQHPGQRVAYLGVAFATLDLRERARTGGPNPAPILHDHHFLGRPGHEHEVALRHPVVYGARTISPGIVTGLPNEA